MCVKKKLILWMLTGLGIFYFHLRNLNLQTVITVRQTFYIVLQVKSIIITIATVLTVSQYVVPLPPYHDV